MLGKLFGESFFLQSNENLDFVLYLNRPREYIHNIVVNYGMLASLEFKIPEEIEEHKNALNGAAYRAILQDLSNWLRGMSKYENKSRVTIDEVRKKIIELCEDHEVSVWS